jgi:hypothetical protein
MPIARGMAQLVIGHSAPSSSGLRPRRDDDLSVDM